MEQTQKTNKTLNLKNDIMFKAFIDDYDRGLVKMAEEKNETLKKARSEMTYLTGDEEIKRMQWLEEKWEMDRASEVGYARREGKKDGIKEGIEKIVRKMKKEKYTDEIIANLTELTIEEVKNIK